MPVTCNRRLAAGLIMLALVCAASAPGVADAQTHASHAASHAQV